MGGLVGGAVVGGAVVGGAVVGGAVVGGGVVAGALVKGVVKGMVVGAVVDEVSLVGTDVSGLLSLRLRVTNSNAPAMARINRSSTTTATSGPFERGGTSPYSV